jgi:membrane protein YqaA with SNARE-associated domain
LISSLFRLFLLFVISFISNATAFFGASYTLLATAELSATGVDLENFVVVVFVTALGATLGKIVIYITAFGLKRSLIKNRNVKLMGTWMRRGGFYVGLFIAALLPILPFDDYVYIGAGANRGRLAPMLGVTFVAKLLKSAFEIFLELSGLFAIAQLTKGFLGLSRFEISIIASAAFVVIGVATYKSDWESIARRVGGLFGRKPKQPEVDLAVTG